MEKYQQDWIETTRQDHYHTIHNPNFKYDYKVAQFGPPRSGTTVVYQIMCSLFNESTKTHSSPRHVPFVPDRWICTVRDPRDIISSFWRVNTNVNVRNSSLTSKMRKDEISQYYNQHKSWLDLVETYHKLDNVIWLKYEHYVNNFDYIFDKIEQSMDIVIDRETRDILIERHSIENNKKFADQYAGFHIHHAEDVSGLHGNHIFTGQPRTWETIVHPDALRYMSEITKPYLDLWNYEV